ncbi:MAG: sigma-70 family RNA polymerase sigma factor [Candidatus Omnitrophica bacterium]|nr:sigma-70 family RNA polymerase sigma factor [Candidatus Omnitrophota bacterium]
MSYEQSEERELLRQARGGDRQAFLQLIQPYHERVYATAMRLLGNREDAAEVTQEALLRTFWKIQSFHGRAHFYTWLYRTALNLCYRRLSDTHAKIERRSVSMDQPREGEEGAPQEIPVPARGASPKEDAVRREEAKLVREALISLNRGDFEILVLREFEELSYDEIARRLKLPSGTVMSRLHRARQALAQRLRDLGLA